MNYLDMDSEQLINELFKRDAEIQALRKDAERYRWLRADKDVEVRIPCGGIDRSDEFLDDAIDAAMEKQP